MDRYCRELWTALNPVQHPSSLVEKCLLIALIGCLGIFLLENTPHIFPHNSLHGGMTAPKAAKPSGLTPTVLSAKG